MTQSPGNSSAPIPTFGPIPMTHPAKRLPDTLLPQIYCIISPPTGTGEEAECLNFSYRKRFHNIPNRSARVMTQQAYRMATRVPISR